MNSKICLVEDEKDLNKILSLYLDRNNYSYVSCCNLNEARKHLDKDIDLWIVDIMLPDGSGIELLKDIKENDENIPVILISARGDSIDRLLGFEVGCDDYITKPFLPEEMIFRIDKILNEKKNEEKNSDILTLNNYKINLKKRTIKSEDKIIDMSSQEFDIFMYFVDKESEAISREELLKEFWGPNYHGSNRVVDNYIKNIRKKLPNLIIETIYGYGYRLIGYGK